MTPPRRARWSVYLLRCRDGSLYAGATNDLARRIRAHARGTGGRYTRSRLPVVLVWSEAAQDRSAALRREAALKRLTRREKLTLVAAGERGAGRGRPERRERRPRAGAGAEPERLPREPDRRPGPTRPDRRARAVRADARRLREARRDGAPPR